MKNNEAVSIDNVKYIYETDKAILCVIDGEEYWIPQSQITEDSEVYSNGDKGTLVITAWFADKEGLG